MGSQLQRSVTSIRGCTYKKVARCSSFDEVQCKAVGRALQHMESLTKAQITENVHSEVIAPVAHLARLGPALVLINRAIHHTNLLAESADIAQNISLHLLHGALRKGLGHDTTLASMNLLVPRVVRVGGRVDKGIVELGFADVCAEAVYLLESLVGVEADRVGAETDDRAVSLVHAPELELSVALPGVVELVAICDLGEERTWVFGERVEEDSVNDNAKALNNC